jgi:hypothetical protein
MFKAQGLNFWKAMRSLDSAGVYDVTRRRRKEFLLSLKWARLKDSVLT